MFEELDDIERTEYEVALKDLYEILDTPQGFNFFKYLVKYLDIGDLPEIGIEGSMLSDRIGYLRAGKSIFELLSIANPNKAGAMLAQIEREKYATSRERINNEKE